MAIVEAARDLISQISPASGAAMARRPQVRVNTWGFLLHRGWSEEVPMARFECATPALGVRSGTDSICVRRGGV